MKLAFDISVRFLKSSKGQTLLIILGIAVGISVQIFIGSLIQGLQKGLVDKTIGNSAQISLFSKSEDKLINDWENKINQIENINKITKVSPSSDSNAFLKIRDNNYPVLTRGFDMSQADKIYNLKNRIYEGKYPTNKNEIILGKDFQKESNVKIGDKVSLNTPTRNEKEVTVVGFFDLKVANINKNWAITTLETSQELFSFNNNITSIEIQVSDPFMADTIANDIENIFSSNNIKVENWKAQNEQLLSGLKGQNVSSIMIQAFVLISVLLGIASVLAITVVQKSKQIGILKAMGIKDKTVSQIFLFNGAILGTIGAIVGILLGLTLLLLFTKFVVNSDKTPVVDIYISYKFIAFSGIVAILVSTLAAVIPALKSIKLDPIEVIKNG